MASPAVIPHKQAPVEDRAAVEDARRAFIAAGFEVFAAGKGLWRVKKMAGGGDRLLSEPELILLAKSLR